ncbi:peptidoglycan recognition protein 6 [Conger conger]|uniref:peptidoglycan recognition protein 6 n=1 Tax=Conger conger TaxID=82655 RepID=UPI002A59E5CE|nr:peptidoglycan recognition protein 6 [Conger conger]
MGSMAINIVAMVALGTVALCHAAPQRTMESFITAVEQVEEWDPEMGVLSVLKTLRRFGGLDDPFVRHFLGPPSETPLPTIPSEASDFLRSAISHRVTETEEEGVVLTGDGTTVALAPLILGVEAGLLAPPGLYPLALARTLGLAFLRAGTPPLWDSLGPGGCWDNLTSPRTFTLSGTPTPATDAVVNGGMDGVILGAELSGRAPKPPPRLSGLLRLYYQHRLQGAGLSSAPRLISPRRRENFRTLVSPSLLQDQVRESLALHRRLTAHPGPEEGQESEAVLTAGVELFVHRYMDCPAIIPRCQWGAEPYRGTPTQLALPLSFLYVHHTYQPGQPCLSFDRCAADMRAMQRFHQDDRGWDDIGYSFVVGSDGYVYEGRGWQWRGAHTKGHNSLGYGVSFIGDYTASLPSAHTLALARDRLTACAVGGARLTANYTVHGHRQLVNTSCPGDALFSEIKGWPHFREVEVKP